MQKKPRDYLLFLGLLCLITLTQSATVREGGRRRRISPVPIPVGVILDLNSSLGSMALNCTNITLQDFYSTYPSYSTKLQLHFRPSGNNLLTPAFAAQDLIDNVKVHAILGPQNSEQARYVVELGNSYDVPVIWFSPSGPSLLQPVRSPFSIRSKPTRSLCFQFKAIAAIIEAYNWESVIPIYEDPEFGNDLIPCLSYAFQDIDTRVPYISAIHQDFSNGDIAKELKKIKGIGTFVFVAHMTVELWSRLVVHAQKEGMMSEGYAWILTQGLSPVIDPKAKDVKEKGYMDGALGVSPFVLSNLTKPLSSAKTLVSQCGKTELSLYGLWAYDTITALAKAVEDADLANSNEGGADLRNETGPELRKAILATDFAGLSGNFSLSEGQLEPSRIVVYNVKEKRDMIIGHWSPERGFFQNNSGVGEPAGKYKLRDPTWPGNTTERPPKLKIGVPKTHFPEFVDVTSKEQDISATGFAVDVFKRVVDVLTFPLAYEFVPLKSINGELSPSSYDKLLFQFSKKTLDVDVIIGDITAVGSRTNCVDFTLPYLDSSVSMMVKVRSDSRSVWILFKPFDRLLWLIFSGIFVGATVTVIILENPKKKKERKDDIGGVPKEKEDDDIGGSKLNSKIKTEDTDGGSKFRDFVRNPFLIYTSDVDCLKRRTSKWVVIVVTFLVGLVVQVYTANLTSILSERTTAKPSPWRDMQEIKRNDGIVGYQSDSWVKGLLINQIGLKHDQLKPLGSRKEYYKAILSKGPDEGGVDAIIDETPYLMLLLSNCFSCKMTGPIYKTGGFAFAFPKNSILVSRFSDAILKVTQDVKTFQDMKKNISLPVTIEKSEYKSDVETRSLTISDFGGLFPMALFVVVLFFSLTILKIRSITLWLRSLFTDCAHWLHKKLVSVWTVSGGGVIFICS